MYSTIHLVVSKVGHNLNLHAPRIVSEMKDMLALDRVPIPIPISSTIAVIPGVARC